MLLGSSGSGKSTLLRCINLLEIPNSGIIRVAGEEVLMKNEGRGVRTAIVSKTSGVLFARCADRFARPGKIVAKVVGAEPLEGKGKNLLTF